MNRNGTIGRGLSALRAGAAPTLFALSCFAAAAQAEDALKIGDVKAVLSVASERSRMPTPMPKRIDLVSSERASVSEGPHVLDSGSKREAAQVYLPKQYGEKDAWPVILLLHGYGGLHGNDGFLVRLFSGSENLIDYYFGMSARVSKSGFILVVPNGNKDSNGRRYWNATPGCCDFDHSQVNDVEYLTTLLQTVESQYRVDRSRIYVVGHSNGGFMAHRLACEKGALIAGIVSFAGVTFKDPNDCKGKEPVSVLQIHALDDDTIKFAGDPGYPKLAPYPGAEATAMQWVAHNGCAPASESGATLDLTSSIPADDHPDTTTRYWRGCAGNTTVSLWTIKAYESHIHLPHSPLLRDEFTDQVLAFLFNQRK